MGCIAAAAVPANLCEKLHASAAIDTEIRAFVENIILTHVHHSQHSVCILLRSHLSLVPRAHLSWCSVLDFFQVAINGEL